MHIIYVHGLDSSCHAVKGAKLMTYMQKHHPNIQVHRPDLNQPPQQVYDKLLHMITKLSPVLLVGSSLGGYFSTLMSNQTACPVCLLNPSTQPHQSLQRLFADTDSGVEGIEDSDVGMVTTGGWSVTGADLRWFAKHQLSKLHHPNKVSVLLKMADEVLDYTIADNFYRTHGVQKMWIQQGGDHRIIDFDEQLPIIVPWMLQHLVT